MQEGRRESEGGEEDEGRCRKKDEGRCRKKVRKGRKIKKDGR